MISILKRKDVIKENVTSTKQPNLAFINENFFPFYDHVTCYVTFKARKKRPEIGLLNKISILYLHAYFIYLSTVKSSVFTS